MKNIKCILLVIALILVNANNTNAQSRFKSGEYIKYDVYYNWGFIWLNAAYADFKVNDTTCNGEKKWHIISKGTTLSSYDWFFKVRDCYETVIDTATLLPQHFICKTNEGGNWNRENIIIQQNEKIAFATTQTKNKPKTTTDTIKLNKPTFDLLSAIYNCRALDFSKIEKGKKIPIEVIIGNELHSLYVRYLGMETVSTRDNKQYNCHKMNVLLVGGSIFKGGEDMTVWVTNDQNQIPIQIEAKILVGSIKAILNSVEGNKYNMVKPFVVG